MTRAAAGALAAATLAGCGAHHRAAPPPVYPVVARSDEPSGEHAVAWPAGRGRVITVAHVMGPGRPVFVARRRARVLRVDRRLDLAVLAVPGLRGAAAPAQATAHAGERAAIRVLRGSTQATVRRLVTARVRAGGRVQVRPALELAATVEPGDSGAPVLDGDGRVIGMVFAAAADRDLAYALDARALAALIDR